MVEQQVADITTQKQQGKRYKDIAHAPRDHVEHDHKEREEQKGRAKVALEDDDEQRQAPHDEHGNEHAWLRDGKRSQADGRGGEHLAVLCEVESQEEDDEDLGNLARLEREWPERQPQLGSALLVADDHRQEEQHHAGNANGVLVVREVIDAGDSDERDDHGGYGDEEPEQLVRRKVGCQARDKRDANAREHERDGQNGWISAWRKVPDGEVRHGKGRKEAQRHAQGRERELHLHVHEVHGIQERHGQRAKHEKQQLGVAAGVRVEDFHYPRTPFIRPPAFEMSAGFDSA